MSDGTVGSGSSSTGGALLGRKDRLQRVRNAVRMLAVAEREVALYPSSHPAVLGAVRQLHDSLLYLLERVDHVTFNIYRGILFLEDEVMPDETARHHRLVERLVEMGIGSVTFSRGLEEDELIAFIELLGGGEGSESISAVTETLNRQGIRNLRVYEKSSLVGDDSSPEEDDSAARKKLYSATMDAVRALAESVKIGRTLDVMPAQNLVNNLLEELLRDRATMIALASMRSHDLYTLGHSVNVCILASALGSLLSINKDPLRSLGLSGLLYDLGTLRIPESILKKGGPLTREEWDIVMKHSSEGAELLKKLQPSNSAPMVVAMEHHMRYDLQGYPRPVDGKSLHLFSRIISICDAYDAMTTRRPFRRAIRPEQSAAILMQGLGRAYDPGITKAFINMLGIYPTGAVVRLSTGEICVVVRPNPRDLLRPRVRVVFDRGGNRLDGDQQRAIDTAQRDGEGNWKRVIVDTLDPGQLGIDMADFV